LYQVFNCPDFSSKDGDKRLLGSQAEEGKKHPWGTRNASPQVGTFFRAVAQRGAMFCASSNEAVCFLWGLSFPFVDRVSTFVGYKPEVDFLKDSPIIP
jgi:hypothetical protein